jgi:adenylate cyclase
VSILVGVPRVRFQPQGIEREVAKGTRLIDAVREAGLPIARACGDDLVCAKCGVRILAGKVTREAAVERRTKARNRVDPELRLACALRVSGDLEISADYW